MQLAIIIDKYFNSVSHCFGDAPIWRSQIANFQIETGRPRDPGFNHFDTVCSGRLRSCQQAMPPNNIRVTKICRQKLQPVTIRPYKLNWLPSKFPGNWIWHGRQEMALNKSSWMLNTCRLLQHSNN